MVISQEPEAEIKQQNMPLNSQGGYHLGHMAQSPLTAREASSSGGRKQQHGWLFPTIRGPFGEPLW